MAKCIIQTCGSAKSDHQHFKIIIFFKYSKSTTTVPVSTTLLDQVNVLKLIL